ncbi:sensor histidine kinase [Actinacidiphila bryophytorum]|uniref:sensor histidine kinase n=1 Tax=Actinacidiphila bryophytorum TaxID=1436133 RepID=UPI00396A8160
MAVRVERVGRAGYARVARWVRLSPPALDAVFAVGLFLASAAALRQPLCGRPMLLVPLHAALVLPLVWRRRAPMAVFCTIAGAALLQWCLDVRIPTDVTLLIALYAVAAYSTRRRTLLAFAVLEGGILLATLRWSMHDRGAGTFVSLSAMATAAMVLGLNMRSRRDRLATLEDRAVRLERERDQQAQLAVAGERARIAREMHDIVTHNLSVMVALADGAVFAQRRSPERAATAMRQVSATGRQAITDMRRFLGVLRADEPDALRHPMPGIGQLPALAEQVRAAGLPTRLEVAGDPAVVPVAAQLTVYRLVQEALTNTLKHASAGASAEVRVECAPEAVAVTVTDDGAGPALPRDPAASAGHGLPGMRERAAAYGGRLTAGPLPGGGWQVAAVLTLITPEPL